MVDTIKKNHYKRNKIKEIERVLIFFFFFFGGGGEGTLYEWEREVRITTNLY